MLVLINGAPGSGKSTLAHLLAQDEPLTLALDIDVIKHALGRWEAALPESGLTARRLAIAMIVDHLDSGRDVIVGQFLARTEFIERLQAVAAERGARFVELVLAVDEAVLCARLRGRAAHPERVEHTVNNALVTTDDVPALARSIDRLITLRPAAVVIDGDGSLAVTLDLVRTGVSGRC
jgi:predicted kinase